MWKTNADLIKKQADFWDEDLKNPGDLVDLSVKEISVGDLILSDPEVLNIYLTDSKDLDKTQKLIEAIESGISIPPLLVKENYEVVDGYHRLLAAKKMGLRTVPCIFLILAKN